MKYLLILFLFSSCAVIDSLPGGKAAWERDQLIKKAQKEQREKEVREQAEKEQVYANKMNLQRTVNLKIGQSQQDILSLFGNPSTVSAEGSETRWNYLLLEYVDYSAPLKPFKITFKNNKVSKFGLDQDQIERDRASVTIKKDAKD